MLNDPEDVIKRKQLAIAALLRSMWLRHKHISDQLRLRLYNALLAYGAHRCSIEIS